MNRQRPRFFSLVEVLIALMLLSMVTASAGIKGWQLLQQQQFKSDVDHLMSRLQLIYDIVLANDRDITIEFITTAKGLQLLCHTNQENSMLQKWIKVTTFKHLNRVHLQNEHANFAVLHISYFGTESKPLTVTLFSNPSLKDFVRITLNSYPHLLTTNPLNSPPKDAYPYAVHQKKNAPFYCLNV